MKKFLQDLKNRLSSFRFKKNKSIENDDELLEEEIQLPEDDELEDEIEENVVFQEMKVDPPAKEDQSQVLSSETLSNPDKTSEIRIDPAKLHFESDNSEADVEVPVEELKEMAIPPTGMKKSGKEKVINFLKLVLDKSKTVLLLAFQKIQKASGKSVNPNLSGQSFEWEKFYEQLFAAQNRKKIHHSFLLTSFLVTAYGVGKLSALIIKGPEKKAKSQIGMQSAIAPSQINIAAIKANNIFNAKVDSSDDLNLADTKPKDLDKKSCLTATKKSILPIELINTVVLQDTVKSIASVAKRGSKEPLNVRAGEKIDSIAEVGKVDRLKLIVKNLKTGECEFLESRDADDKKSQPINVINETDGKKLINTFKHTDIQSDGNKFKIKKAFRDKMLEDVGVILTQARAIQIKNPDGSLAFKMTEIEPGSIYSYLNIQDGDTITKINGKEITNLNEIMTMFGQIKDIDQLSLTVKREGEDVDMDYKFD